MSARREITKKYAKEYRAASKKARGVMLDELVAVTGWSRDNARRQVARAGQRRGPARARVRKQRAPIYGYDTLKVLQAVWAKMGMPSGKYLAATMADTLDALDRFGELDGPRYTPEVRAQLLVMSAATIDRRLAPTKAGMALKGISTTKAGSMLRSSIKVRRAGQASTDRPGFGETDTVAHCGPSARGEYAYTLNLTDVCTGWTEPEAIRNRAHRWVLQGLKTIRGRLPFDLLALDFDNGGEFINHDLVNWAEAEGIELTRSRPYKSNDNAHIEQKNGDVVRRLVFHYRYDTPTEVDLLNELYSHSRLRFNLFTATKKATGWVQRPGGRRVRIYDSPKTPMQRVIGSGVLAPEQVEALTALRDTTNPAQLTREITRIQDQLIKLSAAKTQAATRAQIDEAPDHISRAS
jgi:transposase InsO family protein